jgi:hypothetical protein
MAYKLITNKKFNQDFRGKAEWCRWEFTVNMPEQVGSKLVADQSLQGHIDELENQGCEILEYRMWEDASPTWTTNYFIEVVSTASPIVWAAVIVAVIAAIAVIGLLVTWWIVQDVGEILEYAPSFTLPLLAIAALGVVVVGGLLLWPLVRGRREAEAQA